MKKTIPLIILAVWLSIDKVSACNCGPAYNEDALDEKVYSGTNYLFFTADVISVESAFHLEVTLQIDQIFYGAKLVKDISKPITVFFDLRTECAIIQKEHIISGNKLFITAAYNTMGRMFITNNCDAYFLASELDNYKLNDYLQSLKAVE